MTKRQREPTNSTVVDATGEGSGSQQPAKKRPKLRGDREASDSAKGKSRNVEAVSDASDTQSMPAHNGHAFTVFTDEPNLLEPPPSDLPDYFREPSPVAGPSNNHGRASGAPITSTANAIENQNNLFTFPFPPMQSYPTFPYANDRGSPSPASHGDLALGDERGLIFKAPGFPSSSTVRPRYSSTEGRSVDPSSLTSSDKQQQGSSSSRTEKRGEASGALDPTGSSDVEGSARRTMYGTELETDTRFGDFGMEGVATDYWTY